MFKQYFLVAVFALSAILSSRLFSDERKLFELGLVYSVVDAADSFGFLQDGNEVDVKTSSFSDTKALHDPTDPEAAKVLIYSQRFTHLEGRYLPIGMVYAKACNQLTLKPVGLFEVGWQSQS